MAAKSRANPGILSAAAVVIVALIALYLNRGGGGPAGPTPPPTSTTSTGRATGPRGGEQTLLDAFRAERSSVLVEVGGEVARVLPADNDGKEHQRFIIRLPGGHTVLVAHNLELAPRVPLTKGDRVTVRGEYEWNQQGGVLHWTHDDPAGRHPGGWIEHDGTRYE
jgi:hypothetical protein